MWKEKMKPVSVKFRLSTQPNLNFLGKGQMERVTDFYYDNAEYSLYSNGHSLVNLGNKWINFNLKLTTFDKMKVSKTSFFYRLFPNYRADLERIFKVIKVDYNNKWTDFSTFLKSHNLKVLVSLGQFKTNYKLDENTTLTVNLVDDIGLYLEITKEIAQDEDENETKQELIKRMQGLKVLTGLDEYVTESYIDLYLKKFDMLVYNKRQR